MKTIPDDSYLIILGAMKCGTTSLFSCLSEHPEICPSVVKEPEFFSGTLNEKYPVKHYEDLWHFDIDQHKYVMEATTGYTKYPAEKDVPRKILEYGIRPKFIYIVRDPLERIESHYNFMMLSDSNWKDPIDGGGLISASKYFMQLELYRNYFGKENILVVDFDKFCKDFSSCIVSICEFLEIDIFPGWDIASQENVTKMVSVGEYLILRSPFNKALKYIPQSVKNNGVKVLWKMTGKHNKVRLPLSQRKKIIRILEKDMFLFEREYDFDVSKWGF
jgi:hypothetical protein